LLFIAGFNQVGVGESRCSVRVVYA